VISIVRTPLPDSNLNALDERYGTIDASWVSSLARGDGKSKMIFFLKARGETKEIEMCIQNDAKLFFGLVFNNYTLFYIEFCIFPPFWLKKNGLASPFLYFFFDGQNHPTHSHVHRE
jgi:hypothetical protein